MIRKWKEAFETERKKKKQMEINILRRENGRDLFLNGFHNSTDQPWSAIWKWIFWNVNVKIRICALKEFDREDIEIKRK